MEAAQTLLCTVRSYAFVEWEGKTYISLKAKRKETM